MDKKGVDDYPDDMGRRVYNLTWQGKLWGSDGAIKWSHVRYAYLSLFADRKGEGASALSSTYYTAWGNAMAQIWQGPLWLIRAVCCAFWALSWSRFAEKEIGFKNMNHGQLDIRGSILAKAHMYRKAEKYLLKALEKKDISIDSRALVLCKLGEVLDKKKNYRAGVFFGDARMLINTRDVKNTTRVRVLGALGAHMLRMKKKRPLDYKEVAMMFLKQALEIAERDNLGDQIIKIKALMKKAA